MCFLLNDWFGIGDLEGKGLIILWMLYNILSRYLNELLYY